MKSLQGVRIYLVLEHQDWSWQGSTDKSPGTGLQDSVLSDSYFYFFPVLRWYHSLDHQLPSGIPSSPRAPHRSSGRANELRLTEEFCKLESHVYRKVNPDQQHHLLETRIPSFHPTPLSRELWGGIQHSVSRSLSEMLVPATVSAPLLSRYSITSFPKVFWPLCLLTLGCRTLTTRLPVREPVAPVIPLKVSW